MIDLVDQAIKVSQVMAREKTAASWQRDGRFKATGQDRIFNSLPWQR